jgi:hypothetical protein
MMDRRSFLTGLGAAVAVGPVLAKAAVAKTLSPAAVKNLSEVVASDYPVGFSVGDVISFEGISRPGERNLFVVTGVHESSLSLWPDPALAEA